VETDGLVGLEDLGSGVIFLAEGLEDAEPEGKKSFMPLACRFSKSIPT